MVLRRIAEAIDRRPNTYRVRRSILQIAADEFVTQLPKRKGRSGAWGVSGWDVCNLAHPAFWCMALVSQRRQRYAMTLIGQVHQDQAAVQPYVQEKRATEQVLHGLQGIDPDSLVGFVDSAVMLFQPPGASGAPLVPADQATEIVRLALLRGAMVGELRPDEVRDAWNQAHPDQLDQHGPEVAWKKAQGRAEMLLQSWTQTRRGQGRRLI
ncbi:MAG: hypothetical protein OXT70_04535 [Chloroflexota bacterium]|nr:hypothetical protein [Chloroflexota bacterium]